MPGQVGSGGIGLGESSRAIRPDLGFEKASGAVLLPIYLDVPEKRDLAFEHAGVAAVTVTRGTGAALGRRSPAIAFGSIPGVIDLFHERLSHTRHYCGGKRSADTGGGNGHPVCLRDRTQNTGAKLMIGVVIPACNEESLIGLCLDSIKQAALAPALQSEEVKIVVVSDDCSDATTRIARARGVDVVHSRARNVGLARSLGARRCLAAGARWLAFTDADTVVASDWLVAQLALGTDAVCGTVAVAAWDGYGSTMRERYAAGYRDADDHRHIHGANLGVSASAYRRAGGFARLATGEDVALVAALQAVGASIAWSARPRVVTSARRDFRAPDGFGATLLRVESETAVVE